MKRKKMLVEAGKITKLLMEAMSLKDQLSRLDKARDLTLGANPTFATVEKAIDKTRKRKDEVHQALSKYDISL